MTDISDTWTADNGNGTYTNPLFYDEFSDPDMIRVGDDYYLTGTTMHTMPGLPILYSKDLVNWRFLSYACERLDLGARFRLEGGEEIYGQGFWAPCFRYHRGTFYIFSNVNGQTTQVFRATDPAGPWTHTQMDVSLHDLSVLFEDDGSVYVIWGYREIQFAQLKEDLSGIIPGTQRPLFPPDSLMGEGAHFYRIGNKYYITSSWYEGAMRLACARADNPEGPYEVNPAISIGEDFGLRGNHPVAAAAASGGRRALHQGGLIDTPGGETWGFAMMDYTSVGRLTCLSPITWQDGWPYLGLSGNLGRTPRTWVKPDVGVQTEVSAPYERSDDFFGTLLKPIWQWNHAPDDTKWSLAERPGFLRLHSLPAPDFWWARNTLTQRSIGPVSIPTAVLETDGMQQGDIAGLALLNMPYAWIGVRCDSERMTLEQFDGKTGETVRVALTASRVWLRTECDFLTERASFSYSTDGHVFLPLGVEFAMVYQLKTFQGVRYALFHYNPSGQPGGYADFDSFTIEEPFPRGLRKSIPIGRTITIAGCSSGAMLAADRHRLIAVSPDDPRATTTATRFRVIDLGQGRVAFQSGESFLSVLVSDTPGQLRIKAGAPAVSETFQWGETPCGDLVLLSLGTHRYLRIDPVSRIVSADSPGPKPDRDDGSCLIGR